MINKWLLHFIFVLASTVLCYSQSQTLNSSSVANCSCPGEVWNTSVAFKPSLSFSAAGVSKRIMFNNYGFTIPGDATIMGIEIEYSYSTNATGNTLNDENVLFLYWGNQGGNDKSATTPAYTGSNTVVLGGPTDTWGWFLTPADINDNGFGFNLKLNSALTNIQFAFLNGVQITVYYQLPNGVIEFQKSNSETKLSVKNKNVIFLSEFENNHEISIYNMLGEKLFTQTKEKNSVKTFNMAYLEKGIYVYTIKQNHKTKTGKFLLD